MRISEYKEMIALGAPILHREHTTTAQEPILKSHRATRDGT